MYKELDSDYLNSYIRDDSSSLGDCKAIMDELKRLDIWDTKEENLPYGPHLRFDPISGRTKDININCGLSQSQYDYVGNLLVTLPNYPTPLFFFCCYPNYTPRGSSPRLTKHPMIVVSMGLDIFLYNSSDSANYQDVRNIYTAGDIVPAKFENKPYPYADSEDTAPMFLKNGISCVYSPLLIIYDKNFLYNYCSNGSSLNRYSFIMSYVNNAITFVTNVNLTYGRGRNNPYMQERNSKVYSMFVNIEPCSSINFSSDCYCDYVVIGNYLLSNTLNSIFTTTYCTAKLYDDNIVNDSIIYVDAHYGYNVTHKKYPQVILLNATIDSSDGKSTAEMADAIDLSKSPKYFDSMYDRRDIFGTFTKRDFSKASPCSYDPNWYVVPSSGSGLTAFTNTKKIYSDKNLVYIEDLLFNSGFSKDALKYYVHQNSNSRNTMNEGGILNPMYVYVDREPLVLNNQSFFHKSSVLHYCDLLYDSLYQIKNIEGNLYLCVRTLGIPNDEEDSRGMAILIQKKEDDN